MRRKEKEITQKSEIEAVIKRALVCRLGLSDGTMPYVVPLCFGYKDNTLYLHSALKGKKIDILRGNPNVCFEFDEDTHIKKVEKPCDWGVRFQSVIGFGKASFIEDMEEKKEALNIIMNKYVYKAEPADKNESADNFALPDKFEFPENSVNGTAVIKIEISSITGKRSGL
ncbi:MAG: pyridoxamine 5'-phosphate oxidase family protein [Desulfamplus sp.]|nr:pyridoxamine 5'-phosphate oxidase family protein [Desulfamplus sp.]